MGRAFDDRWSGGFGNWRPFGSGIVAQSNGCAVAEPLHGVDGAPLGCDAMKDEATFWRKLTSLHDAGLDPARWPSFSALADEALGVRGEPT